MHVYMFYNTLNFYNENFVVWPSDCLMINCFQVRLLVGVLKSVGTGELEVSDGLISIPTLNTWHMNFIYSFSFFYNLIFLIYSLTMQ